MAGELGVNRMEGAKETEAPILVRMWQVGTTRKEWMRGIP